MLVLRSGILVILLAPRVGHLVLRRVKLLLILLLLSRRVSYRASRWRSTMVRRTWIFALASVTPIRRLTLRLSRTPLLVFSLLSIRVIIRTIRVILKRRFWRLILLLVVFLFVFLLFIIICRIRIRIRVLLLSHFLSGRLLVVRIGHTKLVAPLVMRVRTLSIILSPLVQSRIRFMLILMIRRILLRVPLLVWLRRLQVFTSRSGRVKRLILFLVGFVR